MNLVPYELKDIPQLRGYKKTKNQKILEQFVESGCECMKVEGFTHRDAWVCAATLKKSIQLFNMTGIDAISRKGEVFLIRKQVE